MYLFLLGLIYIAFISLGLPDSLLGSGWPVMHTELGVPVSYMGIVSMIISGGTIISSLFSNKMTRKFGTRIVTVASVFLTVIALFGFSFLPFRKSVPTVYKLIFLPFRKSVPICI